jgi:pectate lyase
MSEPKTPDLAPGLKTEQGEASIPDQRRETRCSDASRKSAKKEGSTGGRTGDLGYFREQESMQKITSGGNQNRIKIWKN